MSNQIHRTNPFKKKNGFSITEVAITAAIVGTLSSIAYPNYIQSQKRAHCSNSKATMMSIPPIISAYIDATGEAPKTWDELSSIAVVMTSNGPATGTLNTPIKLPKTNYELSIEGPSESTYSLTANCFIEIPSDNPENNNSENPIDKNKYVVRSCINVSNGASDLTSGNANDPDNTPNCG